MITHFPLIRPTAGFEGGIAVCFHTINLLSYNCHFGADGTAPTWPDQNALVYLASYVACVKVYKESFLTKNLEKFRKYKKFRSFRLNLDLKY